MPTTTVASAGTAVSAATGTRARRSRCLSLHAPPAKPRATRPATKPAVTRRARTFELVSRTRSERLAHLDHFLELGLRELEGRDEVAALRRELHRVDELA